MWYGEPGKAAHFDGGPRWCLGYAVMSDSLLESPFSQRNGFSVRVVATGAYKKGRKLSFRIATKFREAGGHSVSDIVTVPLVGFTKSKTRRRQ